MSSRMSADLVCDALRMAVIRRQPAPGLIVHTDRGSQYASQAHRNLLASHGCIASMSGKGNCWDNAVMERFFRSLKQECVWQHHYANHSEARLSITQYIVGFYNATRLHSTLGYLSPNAYELKMAAIQPISMSENT
jgi:transposase InsO family protein